MHVILLIRIEPGDHTRLGQVSRLPGPAAVSLPGPMAAAVDAELAGRLATAPLEWVRTGWSEPWFPMLPPTEIDRQLAREADALTGIGLTPGGLWVTGPWEPRLAVDLARNLVPYLLMERARLEHPGVGVVSHLDAVLPVIPVVDRLDEIRPTPDSAVVIRVSADRDPLDLMASVARLPGCDLTTPTAYLAEHRPEGRVRPMVDDWEGGFDPDQAVLHRKLVRLATRVPERLVIEGELDLLESEAGRWFQPGADLEQPHRALIRARRRVDQQRRRGSDWGRFTRLDWDADGHTELHIELPDLSLVLAPHRSGAIPVLDDKQTEWPVAAVTGEGGWVLCHLLTDRPDPVEISLRQVAVEERRGGTLAVELAGEVAGGELRCGLTLNGHTLQVGYNLHSMPPGRLGPRMALALESPVRVRADGSGWTSITEASTRSGHRFRIASDDHQISAETRTPCLLAVRPGVAGGVVAWPHWDTTGSGSYQMTIELGG